MNPQFAVAADKNSGDPALRGLTPTSPREAMEKANSRNHYGDGQSILFGDGHVEWFPNPFAGVNQDNIYTSADGSFGPPASMNDSVLLPVSNAPFRSGGLAGGTLLWVLIGVVLVGGIAALVFFLSRSKTPLAPVGPPAPPPLPPGVA
jgi:prepilin-type processing-associated H-X9-DG protein